MNVEALYVYPIKSCAGIAVDAARVTARGLEHDRRWMVVDERGGFLTQRTRPEMALVRTAVQLQNEMATFTSAGVANRD